MSGLIRKLCFKALVGGVVVQAAIFLCVYLLSAINIDERAPRISGFLTTILYLAIPGILLLVPEGYHHPHHWLLLAGGMLLDIGFYAAVIFIFLSLIQLRKKGLRSTK